MAVIYTDKNTGQRFKFDDGTTPEQARDYMRAHYAQQKAADDAAAAKEEREYIDYLREHRSGLGSGIQRGIGQIPILGSQLGALGSSLVGAEKARDEFLAAADAKQKALDEAHPQLYSSIAESPMGYFAERMGEQVPNLAAMAASGGLGALGARGAAAAGVGAMTAGRGAAIGAGLGSYGMQAGENYGDYAKRYGADAPGADYAAAAMAVPQAALDVYGLGRLGGAFAKKPLADLGNAALGEIAERGMKGTLARGAAREIPRAMASEGVTEGAQEALKRAGGSAVSGTNEFANPETWGDIGESALVGALVGGPFGGIGGAHAGVRERAEAGQRLANRNAAPDVNWHTPYEPGQAPRDQLQLGYDPSAQPAPLQLEHDPMAWVRIEREKQRQQNAEQRRIAGEREMGPQVPEGTHSPYDPTPNAPGGLSGLFQAPEITPFGSVQETEGYDPNYRVGPLAPFMDEIERANARKPSEFDRLMAEAKLHRQANEYASNEAALEAAKVKRGETPPLPRTDPIVGNDLFTYQEVDQGRPTPQAQPLPTKVEDTYVPVDERDAQSMRSTDEENALIPGVQPSLFDAGQASPRADIVAPFVEAGMIAAPDNRRNTPYARAARDIYERYMSDRQAFDPMDPAARQELFTLLDGLARFARSPISLSTPDERAGLARLREALAADPTIMAANTVPAETTRAPVAEQESPLPTGKELPRLPDKKRQVSAAQEAEVAPEQLAQAENTWNASRPEGVPQWSELVDPQFQQVRRGNEVVVEPIQQDRDVEFQSTLTNDAKNTFSRWVAENPNATPEQVQTEIGRTAQELSRPLDLEASTSNAKERNAEVAAALNRKPAQEDQGRAVKGAGRSDRPLSQTEKSVKEAAKSANEKVKAANKRARGEVPILDEDAYGDSLESNVKVKIPRAARGKETPNEKLARKVAAGGTARDALQTLISSTTDPRHKQLAQRLMALLGDKADKINVNMRPFEAQDDGSVVLGTYTGKDGSGELSLYDVVFPMQRLEETLLHEIIHAATVGAYQDNRAFRREIDSLLAEAKKVLPEWKSSNAYDNPYEFITAALTNPEFRDALQKAEVGQKMSLWDRFVAAVRQLLNRASPLPKSVLERMDEIMARDWQVESLRTPAAMNSELRSTSGKVFENDAEWRKRINEESNTVGTRVKSAFESAVGSKAKNIVAGSTDLRSIAKMVDELAEKVFGKGQTPGQKLVDTLAKQEATDRSVRATFETNALEPLRVLRKKTPEVFSKVQDLLFKSSYMRFDPASDKNPGAPTDAEARTEQAALKKEYNALPAEGKKAFNAVLKSTRESFNEMTQGLLKYNQRMLDELRANVSAASPEEKPALQAKYAAAQASFDRLKTTIEGLGSVGPYVPFMRHGDYLISYVGPDGIQGVTAYDTATARNAAYDAMIKGGATAEKFNRYDEPAKFLDTLDVAGRAAARAIRDVRDNVLDTGTPDDIKSLFDDIETRLVDLLGATTPAARLLQNVRDRQNVPGMHTDILRGLSDYATTAGKALSSLQHGTDIGRAFRDANRLAAASSAAEGKAVPTIDENRVYLKGEELAKAETLVRELNKRREFMMNPTHSPLANLAAKAGFFYFMGANPSSAALQLFQIGLGQFPILAGKYGSSKAFTALYDASTRLFTGDKPLREFLAKGAQDLARYDSTMIDERGRAKPGADERTKKYAELRNSSDRLDRYRAMVVDMLRLGTINDSGTQDLLQFKSGGDPDSKIATVERIAGSMMRWAENTNRLASAMAAFDLAMESRKDWDKALRDASQAVYEGHGDYSAMNSPRWFQTNAGKVMLLFKKFGFHMYTQMAMQARDAINSAKTKEERAEAAKKLGIMLLATGATTGAAGMPMYGLLSSLYYLYQSAFGDDDETRNLTVALRSAMEQAGVSQDMREVMLKGAATLGGINLSSRLGYADVFFRDPEENLDQTKLLEWAATTMGGPMAGALTQLSRGATSVAEGDVGKGVTTMLPSSIRNLGKAWEMGQDGEVKTRRGDPIAETDAMDALLQSVGFRPAQLDLQMDINLAAKAIDQRLVAKRANLLRRYRVAYAAGDVETLRDIREDVVEWNAQARRLSAPKLVVSPDTLAKSVKTMEANNALLRHGMVYSKAAMHVTDRLRALADED